MPTKRSFIACDSWPVIAVLLLLGLLVSACNGMRLPSIPFFQASATPPATEPTLRLLVPEEGGLTAALRQQVTAWGTGQGVQVKLFTAAAYTQELRALLASDDPPDLAIVSSFTFPALAVDALLAPAPAGTLDPAGYPTQLAAAFIWEEVRYCLPREVRTLALVYDKEGFDRAGQGPPTDWESLRTVAIEQTDLNTGRFGLIESPDLSRWLPFLYAAGGTLIDENGHVTLQTPAATTALDLYIQLFRDNFAGHAGESNSAWAGEVLGKRKGGMAVEGNWIVPYLAAEFPAFRYGIAPLPVGPAQVNPSVAFTSCYAVSARSQRTTEAFALATFLNSPHVVRSLPNDGSWMPAQTTLRDEWQQTFPHLAAFAEALPQARIWQLPLGFDRFLRSFNRGMVQLFAADIEAADLLAEMQRVGEEILTK